MGTPISEAPTLESPSTGNPEARQMPPPKPPVLHGKDGKLTRKGMERIIDEGGSVMINGSPYWRKEDLPSEIELAGQDEAKREAAVAAIKAQIAELQASLPGAEDLQVSVRQGTGKRGSQATTDAPTGNEEPSKADVEAAKAQIEAQAKDTGK